jgi:hypothetical protein
MEMASRLPRPSGPPTGRWLSRATGNRESAKGQSANIGVQPQGTRFEKICPFKTLERQSIQDEAMTLYAAITEPHPRLEMQARR